MSTKTKEKETSTTEKKTSAFADLTGIQPNHAVQILIQIAQLAQSKGILSFDDSVYAAKAIEVLTTPPEGAKTDEA